MVERRAERVLWRKPKCYQLQLTHLAYRGDYGGGGNHPRTWELQGSNDGERWTALKKFKDDKSRQLNSWPLDAGLTFFRRFRVQNQGDPNNLCCSGLELYGTLRETRPLEVLALEPACAALVDALCARDAAVAAAVASPAMLLAALAGGALRRSASAVRRLIETYDLPLSDAVVDALLEVAEGNVPRFHELLLDGTDECDALVDALLERAPRLASAIDGAVLLAALQRGSPGIAAALLLVQKRSVEITDAVRELLVGPPTPPNCSDGGGRLPALLRDNSAGPLVKALCAKDAAIRTAVTAPAMVTSFIESECAEIALELLEALQIPIDAELSALLLAKDMKSGKSKLVALVEKSAACEALVTKLCALSATVQSAVVSVDMFVAMARPSTAAAALQLINARGLAVNDALLAPLLPSTATEYRLNEKKMTWQTHEDEAIAWGGHLTSITSEEEEARIKKLCEGLEMERFTGPFIGATRIGSGNGPGPEHWEWTDGSSWEFTAWGGGQPDNSGNREDCVHICGEMGLKWNDIHKDHRASAIYKRGGRPWDALVLSKAPACVELACLLLDTAPVILEPPAMLAAIDNRAFDVALRLLRKNPELASLVEIKQALLENDAKRLTALVLDDDATVVVTRLNELDVGLKEATLSDATMLSAIRAKAFGAVSQLVRIRDGEVSRDVCAALTAGDAAVVSSSALKFESDIYLEDDGSDLPLGNSAYTMEFWARFEGPGCFVCFGHEPDNQCNGAHFDGNRINHFWYSNDLHCDHSEKLSSRWTHVVLRSDPANNKRVVLIDGKQIGEDAPGGRNTKTAPLFIGARCPFSWAQNHDPMNGLMSEVRIWKRALADDELAMELNSAAPPGDLVRWFCFSENDADAGNTVKNYAARGPPHLVMKTESGGDGQQMAADAAKRKWTTRAECGETDDERAGAARAVPRHARSCWKEFVLADIDGSATDAMITAAPPLGPLALLAAIERYDGATTTRLLDTVGLPTEVQSALLAEHKTHLTSPLQQFELGTYFSRSEAIQHCGKQGIRLAYRHELLDGGTKLRVNGGKPFGGDHWTPVLDGDPKNDNAGDGWVQVGDVQVGDWKQLGKNHKETHKGDCTWGGKQQHINKGPWIWCQPPPTFHASRWEAVIMHDDMVDAVARLVALDETLNRTMLSSEMVVAAVRAGASAALLRLMAAGAELNESVTSALLLNDAALWRAFAVRKCESVGEPVPLGDGLFIKQAAVAAVIARVPDLGSIALNEATVKRAPSVVIHLLDGGSKLTEDFVDDMLLAGTDLANICRLKLTQADGSGGLALEQEDVDATQGRRKFHIRRSSAAGAIEVEFAPNGGIVCVSGHHTLE